MISEARMYKVLLWGAGLIYNKNLNIIKLYEKTGELKIVGIIDACLSEDIFLDGYRVYKPTKICSIEYDYLMIMNQRCFRDIIEETAQLGVQKSKIVSYRMLEVPNLNLKNYFSLKNKNISIISNNCWGGILYKALGLECLSPFKNLFLEDADYLRLLSNLEKYMEKPLEFAYYAIDLHSKEKYPVMRVDDVFIHFNHEKEIESAIENWERRKKKINYNELFVEMYTEDKEVAIKFSQLDQYEKKVCFVSFETDIECCMKLEIQEGMTELWQVVNRSASAGLEYDRVDLLNMKRTYRKSNI